MNKENKPFKSVRSILFIDLLFIIVFILCENRWYAWGILVLSTFGVVGYYRRKHVTKVKIIITTLLFMIINVGAFVLTNQISFIGAIFGKVAVPLVADSIGTQMMGTKEEILVFNEMNLNAEWEPGPDYTYRTQNFEDFTAELLSPVKQDHNKAILQLHGGGFTMGMTNDYRNLAKIYSELAKGARVLSPNYRVASVMPYPAALEDCITAYEWLLEEGYKGEDIIVVGDSAGGTLSLALIHYLKDNQIELPKAVIVMSPLADFHLETESCYSRADVCVLGEYLGEGKFNKETYPYTAGTDCDLSDPYLSPLYGDYKGFPDLLIQVGTREIFLDDARNVMNKAKAEGVNVTCTVYNGMFHVFQMIGRDLIPEANRAWQEVEAFIHEQWF